MMSWNANANAATAKDRFVTDGVSRLFALQQAEVFQNEFKLKGFVGGVPLNTETTAVKPRVGITR